MSGDTAGHFPSPPAVLALDLPHIVIVFACVSYVDVVAQRSIIVVVVRRFSSEIIACSHCEPHHMLALGDAALFLRYRSLMFYLGLPSSSKDMPRQPFRR